MRCKKNYCLIRNQMESEGDVLAKVMVQEPQNEKNAKAYIADPAYSVGGIIREIQA